jgi:hypothetical protein
MIKMPPGKGKKSARYMKMENRQGKRCTKLHEPGHRVGNYHQDLEDFEPLMTPVDDSLVAGPVAAVHKCRVGDVLKQCVDRVNAREEAEIEVGGQEPTEEEDKSGLLVYGADEAKAAHQSQD